MIRYIHGKDLLESQAQTLVNTVNCVGVMGKGLAKAFKDRFPEMAKQYTAACKRGELRSGHPFLFRTLDRLILCFPTKDNWKGPSKYELIEAGLQAIVDHWQEWGIRSMAIPPLGCGLGGLEWTRVRSMITRHLGELPIEIEVYEPQEDGKKIGRPIPRVAAETPKVTRSLALLGELIIQARRQMPRTSALGRFLVQKLAFFAQIAGAPLDLRFRKHKYGPYDHNISHMIDRLEGLYIRDTSPTYTRSAITILDETAWLEATREWRDEIECWRSALESALSVFERIDLHRAELLATALYSWTVLTASGLHVEYEDVVDHVAEWGDDKHLKFTDDEVIEALRHLGASGWLGPRIDQATRPRPPTGVGTALVA